MVETIDGLRKIPANTEAEKAVQIKYRVQFELMNKFSKGNDAEAEIWSEKYAGIFSYLFRPIHDTEDDEEVKKEKEALKRQVESTDWTTEVVNNSVLTKIQEILDEALSRRQN